MKSLNKKVKNATPIEVGGIKFRSKIEQFCYKELTNAGISVAYESNRYSLLESFEYGGEKIRQITYKPDFVGESLIVECKGQPNDAWPLREKLFKYWLSINEPNTKFFVVRNQKQVRELVQQLTK